MGNQISEEIKSKRLDNLMVKLNEISKIKNLEMEGQIVEVLVEGQSKNKIQNLTGRTRTFKLINFEGTKDIIGKIIKVKVTEAKTWSLEGIIINE
jgi:tRNA-2-methylthio-N6-dimethylallyladenosine synthase